MIATTETAARTSTTEADLIARAVLERLENAWNQGDGEAFGAVYTDDASFVTIRGEHLRGRGSIAAGHHGILATIYAGSTNRMHLIDARALADDVILASAQSTLDAPHGPLQGVHIATSTSVMIRNGDDWSVAATQNTLVALG